MDQCRKKWLFQFALILLGLSVCSLGFANDNPDRGFYLGLDVGYSAANYRTINFLGDFELREAHDSGISPKIALGYNLTSALGAEIGVIYFQKPHFVGIGDDPNHKSKIKHNVVYAVAKLSIALPLDFYVYAKGGIGYVTRDAITVRSFTALKGGDFSGPVYGLGANYRITSHWRLDVTWMQTPKRANDQIPVSNYYGAGIIYKF